VWLQNLSFYLVQVIQKVFGNFGFRVIRSDREIPSKELRGHKTAYDFANAFVGKTSDFSLFDLMDNSRAQLFQDLFVLIHLDFKRDGFFVEFGATDGVKRSNTWLLEKNFGWTGILAEPCRSWHPSLMSNRGEASIETLCVWSASGETLVFNESKELELSTINSFSESDFHSMSRKPSRIYPVQTITLQDLLEKHNAPRGIDYLSIDTEGSEFSIIENFDFSLYEIDIVTIEHNFSASRESIHSTLVKFGYVRVNESLSSFDDWYISESVQKKLARSQRVKPA
jgi:FkbM family methyltransferase